MGLDGGEGADLMGLGSPAAIPLAIQWLNWCHLSVIWGR